MHRALLPALVVALLALSHSTANAQKFRPFQKMKENHQAWKENVQKNWQENKPDGKILKQIFGDDDDDKEQSEPASSRNQPTPATRPVVTPSKPTSHKKPSSSKSKSEHPTKLGIELSEVGERIVISKVDSKGAAHKAGLKRGDEVLTVAGIDLEGVQELEAIARILNPGDQIEVEIKRKGKKETVIVQFGEAPETEAMDDDDTPAAFTLSDQQPTSTPIEFENDITADLSQTRSGRRSADSVLTDEFTKVAGKWVIAPPKNPRNVLPEPKNDHDNLLLDSPK